MLDNHQKTLTWDVAFSNVRLPVKLEGRVDSPFKLVQHITETLVAEYNTFLSVYCHAGAVYVRLLGQIYLEMGDFE